MSCLSFLQWEDPCVSYESPLSTVLTVPLDVSQAIRCSSHLTRLDSGNWQPPGCLGYSRNHDAKSIADGIAHWIPKGDHSGNILPTLRQLLLVCHTVKGNLFCPLHCVDVFKPQGKKSLILVVPLVSCWNVGTPDFNGSWKAKRYKLFLFCSFCTLQHVSLSKRPIDGGVATNCLGLINNDIGVNIYHMIATIN